MTPKHRAYPKYQKTTVDWLGGVPTGWEIKPCRAIVRNMVEKNEGALDQNYLSLMANVGVIKYEDKGDVGNKKPDDLSKCKIIKKGNLVINSMNYSIGSYGMSEYDGVCSPVYIVLDPDENYVHRRFALRIFENSPFQKYLATFGNGILAHRAAIGWDDIKGAYVPVPPKEEQLAILTFLDHETAKIDTLIDKQQQLIKLLKEKRQAVISHAVTKGLNPDAPMKDSGVEWLGEVPEHWITPKIGYLCEVTKLTGFEYTNYWESSDKGEIVALRGFNVGERFLNLEKTEKISTQLSNRLLRSKLKAGDIVMPCTGTLGNATVIECNDKFHMNQNIAKLSFFERVNPHFAVLWLTSSTFRTIVDFNNTSGMQPVLLIGDIRNMPIPLPPDQEQGEIIKYLDSSNVKYGQIIQQAEWSLNLLQERRTALISAAVTGKIDVRNWQPVQSEIPMEASA